MCSGRKGYSDALGGSVPFAIFVSLTPLSSTTIDGSYYHNFHHPPYFTSKFSSCPILFLPFILNFQLTTFSYLRSCTHSNIPSFCRLALDVVPADAKDPDEGKDKKAVLSELLEADVEVSPEQALAAVL